MARRIGRVLWTVTVLFGLALSVSVRAEMFKCVDANGKVTYQGEKCASDAKMDAMLYRDGTRASSGEVMAAEAIEADRRKLPESPRKAGVERAPAAKPIAGVSVADRARSAHELADYCGEHAARANVCGLDSSAFQRKCHNRIHALTAGERIQLDTALKRMAVVITGPSASKKLSKSECSAAKSTIDREP